MKEIKRSKRSLEKMKEIFLKHNIDPKFSNELTSKNNLITDSRFAEKDSIFCAIKGERIDGHQFIDSLFDKGIRTFVISKNYSHPLPQGGCYIEVDSPAQFSNELAPAFYDFPSEKLNMIGVTGTNGKTSITYLVQALLMANGKNVARIGTIETAYNKVRFPALNTTPEAPLLQKTLHEIYLAGCDTVVMEVSSHALELGRTDQIEFNAAIFTNLTPEHLDFHKTLTNYLHSKLRLFELLHNSKKRDKKAILWSKLYEEQQLEPILSNRDFELFLYQIDEQPRKGEASPFSNTISANILSERLGHYDLQVNFEQEELSLSLALIGRYNILNALAALTLLLIDKNHPYLSEKEIENALSTRATGRMEPVQNELEALILVDYAHSPDALENALSELSKIPHHKLYCVFGCGGDRDTKKRATMGNISVNIANHTILTSDNPRSENPQTILAMIEEGAKLGKNSYEIIEKRDLAIEKAISFLQKGDILLIAGKGHETYQEVKGVRSHFDDVEVAKEALAKFFNKQ